MKNDDEELWELLRKIEEEQSAAEGGNEEAEEDDFSIPEDGGDDGALFYRNYSNGYGRDVRNYSNGYGQGRPAPEPPEPEPGPALHAYNADFQHLEPDREVRDVPSARKSEARKEAQKPAKKKKRRRHGCLTALLCLVLVVGLLIGGLSLWIRPPETDQPIGERKKGVSTILLCGADVGGVRTDTMMLLYIDSHQNCAGLLSLPRDTYTRTSSGLDVKLNSAYGRNDGGEEGMNALFTYVKNIIGYRPDGYVLVELPMLEELVDLMGGVDFDVPTEITFRDSRMDLDVTLEPGMQHLDGAEALGLVRFRYGYYNQDLGRAETQKNFLKACMEQWFTVGNLSKLGTALDLFSGQSLSSLTTGNYLWIAWHALRCGISDMRTDILPGYATMIGDQSYYVLYPGEVAELVNEYYNPYQQDITVDDLHIVTEG